MTPDLNLYSSAEPQQLGRGLIFAMAAAGGLAVANVYYNQPLLGLIEHSYPGSPAIGLIPTATQLGYAIGLFFLVPFGDLVERRSAIVTQFMLLAGALVLAALAKTTFALIAASLVLGVAATVAQQIVPFAAILSPPARRGAVVGTVVSGILCGILLSRTLAGFVGAHFGWREMFWLSVPLAIIAGLLMRFALPRHYPSTALTYPDALKSLFHMWAEEPALRRATYTQAALFASFTIFWTILSLRLLEPSFGYGAEVAGIFGIIGAAGIFAAPLAGRIADRKGPHMVVASSAVATLLSWAIFGIWGTVAGLVVGVVVLDVGVNSALVANQHQIFQIRPEARSRLNTLFMTGMFIGGSLGSLGATAAYHLGGWNWVCVYGGLLALVAIGLQYGTLPRAPR